MNIKRTEVYSFDFPFLQGNVVLSIPAESDKEAVKILKEWLSRVQVELSMSFPETAPTDPLPPTEFNKLQLSLLEDLVKACNLDTENMAKSIKKVTGLALTINNFKAIVPALEALRDGKPYDKKEG